MVTGGGCYVAAVRQLWSLAGTAAAVVAIVGCSSGSGDVSATSVAVATPAAVAPIESTTVAPTTAPLTTIAAATTTSAPSDPRARRPYRFETVTRTFVDTTRSTPATDGELPSRTLETTLYLPVSDEPVPLIVFSHGFGASPAKFERLLGAWAAAGYAVAAPAFPLTNDTLDPARRVVGDVVNQAGDVVFVLDQLLGGDLAGRFDPQRLAAAGLSLGGLTTYLAAIDDATRDARFTSAIVMAAVPPGEAFAPHDLPVLVMHGELDPVVQIGSARSTFAKLHPPAYEVTMLGAFHAEAFEDAEENVVFPDRARFHPVVDATTVAFWDTYLLAVPSAAPEIAAAADRPGISTIESRTG